MSLLLSCCLPEAASIKILINIFSTIPLLLINKQQITNKDQINEKLYHILLLPKKKETKWTKNKFMLDTFWHNGMFLFAFCVRINKASRACVWWTHLISRNKILDCKTAVRNFISFRECKKTVSAKC